MASSAILSSVCLDGLRFLLNGIYASMYLLLPTRKTLVIIWFLIIPAITTNVYFFRARRTVPLTVMEIYKVIFLYIFITLIAKRTFKCSAWVIAHSSSPLNNFSSKVFNTLANIKKICSGCLNAPGLHDLTER